MSFEAVNDLGGGIRFKQSRRLKGRVTVKYHEINRHFALVIVCSHAGLVVLFIYTHGNEIAPRGGATRSEMDRISVASKK